LVDELKIIKEYIAGATDIVVVSNHVVVVLVFSFHDNHHTISQYLFLISGIDNHHVMNSWKRVIGFFHVKASDPKIVAAVIQALPQNHIFLFV
jgi:hypothetical protein